MVDPLRRRCIGDKLAVAGRQSAMATPEHLVAVDRAGPDRTVCRPAFRVDEQTFGKPLGDPPMMGREGQIDVNKRIGSREPLPCGRDAAEAVDDPLVPAQQLRMRLQVLLAWNLGAAWLVLDQVERMERQSSAIPSFFRGPICNWRLALRCDESRMTSPEAQVRDCELSRHAQCGTFRPSVRPL